MMSFLKAISKGFNGGPDFSRVIDHKFIIGNKVLSIKLPDSNVVTERELVDKNFIYTSDEWFEHNAREFNQHKYINIMTENWMYFPVKSFFSSDEYGMLSFQSRIKRTDKIDVFNLDDLAKHVVQEYDDFHNGPNGRNTEIREATIDESNRRAPPFSDKKLQEEIDGRIESYGMPAIPQATLHTISGKQYVFYQESRANVLSYSNYYCLSIDTKTFLEIEFRHRVDIPEKWNKWKKHAKESELLIMESVSFKDLPEEQNNFLN